MNNLKNFANFIPAAATGRSGVGPNALTRSLNSAANKKYGSSKLLSNREEIELNGKATSNSKRQLQSSTRPNLAPPAAVQPALDSNVSQSSKFYESLSTSREDETVVHEKLSNAPNHNLHSEQSIEINHSLGKSTDKFVDRHLGPTEDEIQQMLQTIGYQSIEQLIEDTIPEEIRLKGELCLPEALSEHQLIEELRQLGKKNTGATEWRSFIGLGYYDCVTPSVILRNIFENPGWTTAYTAYQAEIAQGRLESLMNFQTMVSDLTGLDVANASLLDEATAAAEAMQVCLRVDQKRRRNKFLMSSNCHPQTRAVVQTRAEALEVQVDEFDERTDLGLVDFSQYSGVLVQYPNTSGLLFDLDPLTRACHAEQSLVVVATDLLACTLFKPPGDFSEPADLAIGSAQRLGVPFNYGGPHAAFLACQKRLLRSIPGRVVGVTRDSSGSQAYRFALQTREQHIRRDKATSNICTAQALLANMSAMYAIYHGPKGLRLIAESIHYKTNLLANLMDPMPDVSVMNREAFFDTLTMRIDGGEQRLEQIKQRAREAKINLRFWIQDDDDATYGGDCRHPLVSISLDECTKLTDVFQLASLFSTTTPLSSSSLSPQWNNNKPQTANKQPPLEDAKLAKLKRETTFLDHATFNKYHSEAQLVRYMKQLENKDISLAHSMIPLGSCTMKLNSTTQMLASTWPEFARNHPFQPREQSLGYELLFKELSEYLCEITGYDSISFQPNSGAQGEYAGLRAIKAYLDARDEAKTTKRTICLIPISAHGTNPASAQMAGFQCQSVRVNDEHGNIDMGHLRELINKYRDQLACLMITYPSTFGIFEENIREMCNLVHEAGGQVYLDGANMNAQVGLCRPGDYGSDVSHLNLHKTFCIPHGGGGPGAGPIGVKAHLTPYLPSHPLVSESHQGTSFGAVSASAWGSPAILPISWSYIRLMGKQLAKSSELAILNANYMRARLENDYKILFRGRPAGNVAHEFILDCRPFKKTTNIEAIDIAKRLQDFGLHAPTVSWPVANTLMIEPTESEDKQQLDNYCEALLQIRREIRAIEEGQWPLNENPIKGAPHTQQVICSSHWNRPYSREQAAFPASFVKAETKIWPSVGRVDDTFGDTNLFCSCPSPEFLSADSGK